MNEVVKCLLERIAHKTVGSTEERIDAARRALTSIQFSSKRSTMKNDQGRSPVSSTVAQTSEERIARNKRIAQRKVKGKGRKGSDRMIDEHLLSPEMWPNGSFSQLASTAAPRYREESSLLGITQFLNQTSYEPSPSDPLDELSLLLGEHKETAIPYIGSVGEHIRYMVGLD